MFTGDVLLAVLTGGLVGGGVLLLIAAIRGLPVRPAKANRRSREEIIRTLSTRGATAILLAVLVLVTTRWVTAAAATALLVVGWKGIAGGASEERLAMAKVEALAAWTESLRDTIAGAVGLEQAIPASLRAAGPALQSHLRTLVDRLHTRVPLPEALRRFADDLDDPSADLVLAALILNSRLRGPGLREMLGALSNSARDELDMRRKVEADRRTTRRSVQIVVFVSVGTALLLAIFNHSYVEPFDDLLGQLVLCIVIALYAAGFLWLRRLAKYEMPSRFLSAPEPRPGVPGEIPASVAGWQDSNTPVLRGRHAMDAGGGTP